MEVSLVDVIEAIIYLHAYAYVAFKSLDICKIVCVIIYVYVSLCICFL